VGEHRAVTSDRQDKTLFDHALDLFVYAPIGAALAARELLPELSERGRRQLTGQVTMARMMGEFAVRQGRGDMEKAYERAREQATATLQTLGVVPPPPAARDGRDGRDGRTAPPSPAPAPRTRPAAPARPATPPGPGVDTLAVPDYDSLSASQVVPRLAGLTSEELDAVRRYEAANRARKTILHRIDQLTS